MSSPPAGTPLGDARRLRGGRRSAGTRGVRSGGGGRGAGGVDGRRRLGSGQRADDANESQGHHGDERPPCGAAAGPEPLGAGVAGSDEVGPRCGPAGWEWPAGGARGARGGAGLRPSRRCQLGQVDLGHQRGQARVAGEVDRLQRGRACAGVGQQVLRGVGHDPGRIGLRPSHAFEGGAGQLGGEQTVRPRPAVGVRARRSQHHGSGRGDAGGGGEGLADGSEEVAAHQLAVVGGPLGRRQGTQRHPAGVGHRQLGGNRRRIGDEDGQHQLVAPYAERGRGGVVDFVTVAEGAQDGGGLVGEQFGPRGVEARLGRIPLGLHAETGGSDLLLGRRLGLRLGAVPSCPVGTGDGGQGGLAVLGPDGPFVHDPDLRRRRQGGWDVAAMETANAGEGLVEAAGFGGEGGVGAPHLAGLGGLGLPGPGRPDVGPPSPVRRHCRCTVPTRSARQVLYRYFPPL